MPAILPRRVIGGLGLVALLVLGACANLPNAADILPGYPAGRTYTEAEAHATLALVAERRALWGKRWAAATARCHERFLASACESDVRAERRVVEAELDRVSLEAGRALREHQAIARNAREASSRQAPGSVATGAADDGREESLHGILEAARSGKATRR